MTDDEAVSHFAQDDTSSCQLDSVSLDDKDFFRAQRFRSCSGRRCIGLLRRWGARRERLRGRWGWSAAQMVVEVGVVGEEVSVVGGEAEDVARVARV